MLDTAQLQQLAQAAAAATGNTFERGIPITISTQGTASGSVVNAGSITINAQQAGQGQQGSRGGGGQQTGDNQSGDYSGISNLFC